MKKMKKVVAVEASPFVVYEDSRTRFKHQSLMQDYEELEKETMAMKSRLQVMESKKLTLLAEVRFLRRRFKHLTEKQLMKRQTKRDHAQMQNHSVRSANIPKGKNFGKKESALRYPPTLLDLNQKERAFNAATETPSTSQKSAPIFDLNQQARVMNGKEAAFQNSRPIFDLNQQDRVCSGKETMKRKNIQSFDLNQISGEEEELQDNPEPLKGLLRSGSTDEQQNDMKLLVCRNIGTGPNRSGKRKITWQDQVALRV